MKLLTAVIATLVVFSALSCATPDPVRRFPGMVADMNPIPIGSVYAILDRPMGRGLNTVSAEAVFHPRLNSVSLEFRYGFVTYRQFWDETGRRHFAAALERYNEDFNARNLTNRHRRTRNAYGSVNGRLEWQTARFTTNNVSYPVIEIGYRFRENSPFFTTLTRTAMSEETLTSGSGRTESRQILMYFTRAQAADLVRIFDQAFLMGLVEMYGVRGHVEPLPVDEFYELTDEQAWLIDS